MRILLLSLLFSGCVTTGLLGQKCDPERSCKEDGVCVFSQDKFDWICVTKEQALVPND